MTGYSLGLCEGALVVAFVDNLHIVIAHFYTFIIKLAIKVDFGHFQHQIHRSHLSIEQLEFLVVVYCV